MGLESSSGQRSPLTRIVSLSRCEVKGLSAFMGLSLCENFNEMREVFGSEPVATFRFGRFAG